MDDRLKVVYTVVKELEHNFFKCKNRENAAWVLFKGNRRVGNTKYIEITVTESDRIIVKEDRDTTKLIDDTGKVIVSVYNMSINYLDKHYLLSGLEMSTDLNGLPMRFDYINRVVDKNGKQLADFSPSDVNECCGMIIVRNEDRTWRALDKDLNVRVERCEILNVSNGLTEDYYYREYIKEYVGNKYNLITGLVDGRVNRVQPTECDSINAVNRDIVLIKDSTVGILYTELNETSIKTFDEKPIDKSYNCRSI